MCFEHICVALTPLSLYEIYAAFIHRTYESDLLPLIPENRINTGLSERQEQRACMRNALGPFLADLDISHLLWSFSRHGGFWEVFLHTIFVSLGQIIGYQLESGGPLCEHDGFLLGMYRGGTDR
jgi:hypothetical protein